MSFVDLMGDTTFTEAQIGQRLLDLERQRFSAREELVLSRIAAGISLGVYTSTAEEQAQIGAFNAFMGEMVALAAQVRADNQLLVETLAYEEAQRRLSQAVALDGRAEQLAVAAICDETGNVLAPAVPYLPAVEPVPEFIEIDGEQVRNPVVVQDEAERAAAQAVIDGAGADILDLAGLRGGKVILN